MKDKDLIDMLLRLEAQITQLENHHHTFTDFDGRLGRKIHTKKTSKPKITVAKEKAK